MKNWINVLLPVISFFHCGMYAGEVVSLKNDRLELQWEKDVAGRWLFTKIILNENGNIIVDSSGENGVQYLLYSLSPPPVIPDSAFFTNQDVRFPEPEFDYCSKVWKTHTTPVSLNRIGIRDELHAICVDSADPLTFISKSNFADIVSIWTISGNEVRVKQTLNARITGYYSLSTPVIFQANKDEIKKAIVPGYLHANRINKDFVSAYGYGYYIPDIPVIYRDKCSTTPASILEKKNDMTIGIAPEAQYPRMPHDAVSNTHDQWHVGIASLTQKGNAAPILYYPVLGQQKSYIRAGESVDFEYRYVISGSDWYDVFKQIAYNVYDFEKTKIIRNSSSLTERVSKILEYLTNRTVSRFRVMEHEGAQIGAHDYAGGVRGSKSDAMKNSDYGAMWMLSVLSGDRRLSEEILPYARNFKLKQEYVEPGKYQGAARGQYFLWKSKQFVEEWGDFIEPVGVAYYAISDLGNILLFEPNDWEAKENLRLAANYLLNAQQADGSWVIGIRKDDDQVIYPDLQDWRPTFYGLVVAYQMLGDEKYLKAAKKGADWFIEHAVRSGRFIGVCGDTRLSPDFATAQSAQMLLDLYDVIPDVRYRDAAVETAKMYTTYIYTYPNGQTDMQKQEKQQLPGWAFSQSGLCFEHAGTIGSANTRGPILLASFTGFFVRMYRLTGDKLFLDMARAGANGKDAFVESRTGVASYYWDSFNEGPGAFPHHAWWQVGWIMDYLVSEAELRSNGEILFPRGFVTAKVGPHKTLGFTQGKVIGKDVSLIITPGLVNTDNPWCETLAMVSQDALYVVSMNSSNEKIKVTISVDGIDPLYNCRWKADFSGMEIEPYGIKISKINTGD